MKKNVNIRPNVDYDPGVVEKKWPFDSAQGKPDYNHKVIESKWQKVWLDNRIYEPDLASASKPYYNLMMFPYPSAEGLHVGNMYAFCGSDIYGRFKRMQGNEVFEPIGLDGFGIHSENYAMKIGEHPAKLSKRTQENFYRQLSLIGNGFAWRHKLETYDPQYYRWTQWIFIQLFKAGLAYRGWGEVNWCPSCKTVLADEQVVSKNPKSEARNPKQTSNLNVQKSTVVEEIHICERCGAEVEKKKLAQWYFKITAYAQRLLGDLDKIDWSEKVKVAQRVWIGKSEGAQIVFSIDIDKSYSVRIFTTRADTLFGVTFLALAGDHDLVTTILKHAKGKQQQAIREFLDESRQRLTTNANRLTQEEKSGVFTGFFAVSPISGEKVPVYIADYVLTGYGTGAVMGVPAHDQRDWEFAKKYKLEVRPVIVPERQRDKETKRQGWDFSQAAFTDYGELIDSGKYNGMKSQDASSAIVLDLKTEGRGDEAVNWHLRDWIISRQRYWGPPIPMIYCGKCAKEGKSWFSTLGPAGSELGQGIGKDASMVRGLGGKPETLNFNSFPNRLPNHNLTSNTVPWDAAGWYPVPEEDLPVQLPYIENFKPTGSGVSPLAQDLSFVKANCPGCGSNAKRETDVSDTFLDSAWYFLRYPSVRSVGRCDGKTGKVGNVGMTVRPVKSVMSVGTDSTDSTDFTARTDSTEKLPWDMEVTRRWLPVDMYIGGAEHAVLHLLYSRFITKAFFDMGLLEFDEPFTRFRAHGLLIRDGAKMSKSKGNVVNPDDYIAKFGADTLRAYLMFCGRFSEGGDFRDDGIEGMQRFLRRVWKLSESVGQWVSKTGKVGKIGTVSMSVRPVRSVKSVHSPMSVGTDSTDSTDNTDSTDSPTHRESLYMLHKTIKKVTEDIEGLSYNTAIAALMEWVNFLERKAGPASSFPPVSAQSSQSSEPSQPSKLEALRVVGSHSTEVTRNEVSSLEVEVLLKLLAPFMPYMTEELWQKLTINNKPLTINKDYKSIHLEIWPEFDEKLALGERVTLIVQVDGKLRGKIEAERGISEEDAKKLALGLDNVSKYIKDGSGFGVVFVGDRLINFVSKSGNN